MSEIRTSLDFSLDFRQFNYVLFPSSSDFGQCLESEQKRLDFGHFFLPEIRRTFGFKTFTVCMYYIKINALETRLVQISDQLSSFKCLLQLLT